jgi:hypothetical protein
MSTLRPGIVSRLAVVLALALCGCQTQLMPTPNMYISVG